MAKYRTKDVLIVSSYFTSKEGYIPVSKQGSTKDKVIEYLSSHDDTSAIKEYQDRAEKAIRWIQQEKSTEWVDSLRSTLRKKEIDEFAVGLVSSIFSGYDRYLKKEEEKVELRKSQFQGLPKDSISFQMKSYKILYRGKSKFNDSKDFYITQILDFNGNVYIWYADKDPTSMLDNCSTVNAIIKSLHDREGVQQTVIDVKEMLSEDPPLF